MNVYVDGRFALALQNETVLLNNLKIGVELTAERMTELTGKDTAAQAMETAVRYLGYRPRSEAEIKTKLQGRFTEEVTDIVIARLKDQKLIDDVAFANFWKDNRDSFSPRSSWLTRRELKKKGVSDEITDQVLDTEADEDSAYKAALQKAHRMNTEDYTVFRQRLGEYLKRRGFGYGVIKKTIAKIWQEHQEQSPA